MNQSTRLGDPANVEVIMIKLDAMVGTQKYAVAGFVHD
jgi:hypothetical protein